MAKVFIEIERLILREIIPEDAEAFFAMDSNPEVVKYVGIKPLTRLKHQKTIRRKRSWKMGSGL